MTYRQEEALTTPKDIWRIALTGPMVPPAVSKTVEDSLLLSALQRLNMFIAETPLRRHELQLNLIDDERTIAQTLERLLEKMHFVRDPTATVFGGAKANDGVFVATFQSKERGHKRKLPSTDAGMRLYIALQRALTLEVVDANMSQAV